MKDFLKRALALFLSLTMVLGILPLSVLAEEYSSDPFYPFGDPASGPEDVLPEEQTAENYFDEIKNTLVKVIAKPVTANTMETGHELVGRRFRYDIELDLPKAVTWQYKDTMKSTNLFDSMDNLSLRVKAPEGIKFVDADGAELPLVDGYYEIIAYSTVEMSSQDPTILEESIFAVMTGNGQTKSTEYGLLDFRFDCDVTLAKTYAESDDPQTEVSMGTGNVDFSGNNSKVWGVGEAEWGVSKKVYTPDSTGYHIERKGDKIVLSYTIEVGRSVNGIPQANNDNYVRYGLLDLSDFELTDLISEVKDKDGNEVYPDKVTITSSNGDAPYVYEKGTASDIISLTLDESTLAKVDASAVGLGEVYAYTTYLVELEYPAANFTYSLIDPNKDNYFDFTDSAEIEYELKGDSAIHEAGPSSSTQKWKAVAGGGDVRIEEYFFLSDQAQLADAEPYNEYYQRVFSVSGSSLVKYTLYLADEDGNILRPEGEWHDGKEIFLTGDGNNGHVDTSDITALMGKIPEGKIAIVPDYTDVDKESIVVVDSSNTTSGVQEYYVVDVQTGATATLKLYLRYKQGGFVNVNKEFYGYAGNKLTTFPTTTFTLTNKNDDTKVYTLTTDSQGAGIEPIPAGEYTVVENAPTGYIPATIADITVNPGDKVWLGGSKDAKIKNYPTQAKIQIKAKTSDKWVDGNASTTDSGAAAVSDATLTYEVFKKVNGEWVTTGKTCNLSAGSVEIMVDRYDENGEAVEYCVRQTGCGTRTLYGDILNSANAGMSTETDSVSFKFDTDTNLTYTDIWYYQNFMTVKVTKTVTDGRSDKSTTPESWDITLSSSDTSFEAQTGTVVVGTATSFADLPMTDAAGSYVTYTVAETLPEGQETVWTTTYKVGSTATPSVKAAKGVTEKTIAITNTANAGKITIKKADADAKTTYLEGASFNIYAVVDGTNKYVVADAAGAVVKANGICALSELSEGVTAAVFTTDANGQIVIPDLPSGYKYYAVETEAPENYFVVEGATLIASGALAANGSASKTIYDTHKPYLTIEKNEKNPDGSAATPKSGDTVTFWLYEKARSAQIVRSLDAEGNPIVLTATANGDGFSVTTQLEDYGFYYLYEAAAGGSLMLVENDPVIANLPEEEVYDNGLDSAPSRKKLFGPIAVTRKSDGTTAKVSFAATDTVNTTEIKIKKYDSGNNTEVTGSDFSVYLVAKVREDDTVTPKLLSGWSTTCPAEVSDAKPPVYVPYVWYYSPKLTCESGDEFDIPRYGANGDPIEYAAIEADAPYGYRNKIDPASGTEGHHFIMADMGRTPYQVSFSDSPVVHIGVWSGYESIHALETGNGGVIFGLEDVEVALYHVDEYGVIDACLGEKSTTDDFEDVVFDVPLDINEHYVLIQTNSSGMDAFYERGVTHEGQHESWGRVDVDAGTFIGKTVSSLEVSKDYKLVDLPSSRLKSDLSDDEPGYLYGSYGFIDYKPYVQLRLHKRGWLYDPETGTMYVDEANLNLAKYTLYQVPKDQFDASNPAASCLSEYASEYPYETGTAAETEGEEGQGAFNTLSLPFDEDRQYVFILKETTPPPTYQIMTDEVASHAPSGSSVHAGAYSVFTFDQYQPQKNELILQQADNYHTPGEGGDSFYRYYRIVVDKYVDQNNSGGYDQEWGKDSQGRSLRDWPLSEVTFTVDLIDKGGNVITLENDEDNPFKTMFTTGVELEFPGTGVSETTILTSSSIKAFAGKVGADRMDSIFTFTKQEGTEIVSKTYADFLADLARMDEPRGDDDPSPMEGYDMSFKLRLTEAEFPDNTTPFHLTYDLTITTGRKNGFMTTNRYYTVDPDDVSPYPNSHPIMNAHGKFVLAEVQKLVAPNGDKWVPASEDDYVAYTVYASDPSKIDEDDREQLKRVDIVIDSSNYMDIPLIQLAPDIDYYVTETHAPIGYELPTGGNKQLIHSFKLSSRVASSRAERVQTVNIVDKPYITVTVKKVDSTGAPASGIKLRLDYSADKTNFSTSAILDANAVALPADQTMLVTGQDGTVTFTVPYYDYRSATKSTHGATGSVIRACSTAASYRVVEIGTDGAKVNAFDVINGDHAVITAANAATKATASNPLLVVNPEKGSLKLVKLQNVGAFDANGDPAAETKPLAGVTFDVYILPMAKQTDYTSWASHDWNKSSSKPDYPYWHDDNRKITVTTNGNGEISLPDLDSCYLRFVEKIPEGMMYAGEVYSIYARYITAGDVASLKLIGKTVSSLVGMSGGAVKGTVFPGSNIWQTEAAVASYANNQDNLKKNYNTVTYSNGTFTVTNTAKAYIKVEKTFEGATSAPKAVTVNLYKTEAGSTALYATKTLTFESASSKAEALFEVEPGTASSPITYSVEEIYPDAGWFASYTLTNGAKNLTENAKLQPKKGTGGYASKVEGISVTPANTATVPAVASFINHSGSMGLSVKKVDELGEPIQGAQFIVYEIKNGTKYYFKGTNTATGQNGLGKFATGESGATVWTSDEYGAIVLTGFVADYETAVRNEDGTWGATYYLHEIKADEEWRKLAPDTEIKLVCGQTVDQMEDPEKWIVDGDGVSIDFTLYGHTYENIHDTEDPAPKVKVEGATFKLYEVTLNPDGSVSNPVQVTTYDDNGNYVSEVTTGTDGFGYFHYLKNLPEGKAYVLVETSVADGYWETTAPGYTAAEMNSEKQPEGKVTVNGLPGYVVYTGSGNEGDPAGSTYKGHIDVYNRPESGLLILKYNYDFPAEANKIPQDAIFSVTGEQTATAQVSTSEDATERFIDAAFEQGYVYVAASKYYSLDTTKYSFAEIEKLLPGTYTVTETTQAVGFFYTPDADPADPWYPTKSDVIVDDRGGITVVAFANVANPGMNDVNLEKSVTDVNGKGAGATLFNLQLDVNGEETADGSTWQNITYTISNFAPCKENGVLPEAVKYKMNELYLEDRGQQFTDTNGTSLTEYVDSFITGITVGKANYVNTPAASMIAAVYGVNGGEENLIKKVDVANGSVAVSFPSKTYSAFKIVYGYGLDVIEAGFKAEPVTVRFIMNQKDGKIGQDTYLRLVANVKNIASVTMGYDIGIKGEDTTFTVTRDADVPAEPVLRLPVAKLGKTARLWEGTKYGTKIYDKSETMYIKPEDQIEYTLSFENLSSNSLSIPEPYIADVLPECIDILTVKAVVPSGMTAEDPVIDGVNVTVKTHGELQPGQSVKLIIEGKVNTGRVLEMADSQIRNEAYAGSTVVLKKNDQNKTGAPFREWSETHPEGSEPSYTTPVDGFREYGSSFDYVDQALALNGALIISKLVAGDVTGASNWMSGSKQVAITNPKGNIYYKISVSSKESVPAGGNLRIADLLPEASGDKGIDSYQRYSEFKVTEVSSISVTKNGNAVDYDIWYTTSASPAVYANALANGAGSGWTKNSAGAKGFLIVINDGLEVSETTKDQITITFVSKAPDGVETVGGKKVVNYYKQAINDATALLKMGDRDYTVTSNPVHVTIMPDQKANIGDRAWLDKNANGIQDEGEPDFKGISEIRLRTYENSNRDFLTGSVASLSTGWYNFNGLNTGMPKDASSSVYTNGDADNSKLNGSLRYLYQLAVNSTDIPVGYVVTKPYATNGGTPTTFGVETYEIDVLGNTYEMLVYDQDTSDGCLTDSDFVLKDGVYVSSRFYLPLQAGTGAKLKDVASYPNFDIGVVRVRDLEIEKLGIDNAPVEGAVFKIYGPFDAAPTIDDAADSNLIASVTTDKDGKALFTSSTEKYLNYYQYYLVVEDSIELPYEEKIIKASFESESGNAVIGADLDNFFVLKPATDKQTWETDVPLEETSMKDLYTAEGSTTLNGTKELLGDGVSITDEGFKGLFRFKVTSGDDPDFEPRIVNNSGSGIDFGEFTFTRHDWIHDLPGSKVVYHYTIKEIGVEDAYTPNSITLDTSEYVLTLTLTDDDASGVITIEKSISKNGTTLDKLENKFSNEIATGDLNITKAIQGTPYSDDDAFEFTVRLTPEKDMEKAIWGTGKTFKVVKTDAQGGSSESTVTFTQVEGKNYGEAKISIKRDETATIKDIPAYTQYAVSETDASDKGYKVSFTGSEGTITADETKYAACVVTNTRKVGSLEVGKTTAGTGADKVESFKFTTVLTYVDTLDLELSGNQPVGKIGETAVTPVIDATAHTATFTYELKKNETIVITNIVLNDTTKTTYTVTEESYKAEGYTVKINGSDATLDADGRASISGNVAGTEKVEVAYENKRDSGDLKLSKVLAGNAGDIGREFTFTVKMWRVKDDGVDLAGTYATDKTGTNVTFAAASAETGKYGVVTAEITLKGGETLTVMDIPVGTQYEVAETDASDDGFNVSYTNNTGYVVRGAAVPFTATNTRKVGSLEVGKTTAGTGADKVESFKFTTVLTYVDTLDLTSVDNQPVGKIGETAVTPVIDGNAHTATFTYELKNGEKLVITNIVLNDTTKTTYTVTEDSYKAEGYTVKINGSDATLDADGRASISGNVAGTEKVEVAYENKRDSGDLKLSKVLAGNAGDVGREFTFTVKLWRAKDDGVNLAGIYATDKTGTNVTFAAASAETGKYGTVTAEITLKGGETLTVKDIPAGTQYEVTEADASDDGFKVSYTNNTGSVVSDSTATCTATNTRNVGGLKVSKTVTGSGKEAEKLFSFTTVLTYAEAIDLEKAYNQPSAAIGDTAVKADIAGQTATFTYTLKDGENIVFTNILLGTGYTVYEADYTEDGYSTTVNGSAAERDGKGNAIATGTVSEAGKDVTVEYKNNREAGGLIVQKVKGGNAGDIGKEFEFTVTLKHATKKINLTYVTKKTKADGTEEEGTLTFSGTTSEASATFVLKVDEQLLISDIPEGATYKVAEKQDDLPGLGFTAVPLNPEGTIIKSSAKISIWTNTRNVGSLEVSKTASGTGADKVAMFKFTTVLTYAETLDLSIADNQPVGMIGEEEVLPTISTTDHTATFTAELMTGDKLVITNVVLNDTTETTYTVTEDSYKAEGYTVKINGKAAQLDDNGRAVISGNVSGTDKVEASYENIRNSGDLTVSKVLAGNATDIDHLFSFKVKLWRVQDDGVNLAGTYVTDKAGTDVTFETASAETGKYGVVTAEIVLMGGESLTMQDIPLGTDYEVTESDSSDFGFAVSYLNNKGSIASGTAVTCTATNTRNVGSLEVTKTTAGTGADKVESFKFTTVLTYVDTLDLTVEDNLPVGKIGETAVTPVIDTDANTATFSYELKKNETIVITNIVLNDTTKTTYLVSEDSYKAEGYTVKINGSNAKLDEDGRAIISGSVSGTDKIGVSYENKRDSGDLKLSKVLAGNASEIDREFTFNVKLTRKTADGVALALTYDTVKTAPDAEDVTGTITFTEAEGAAVAAVTLKGGETLTIKDIPVGTEYSVEETGYADDGFKLSMANAAGSVASGTEVTCTATNTRNVGSLEVTKTTAGTGADKVESFKFTTVLTYVDTLDLTSVDNRPVGKIGETAVTPAIDTNAHTATFTYELKKDETIVITNIVLNDTTKTTYLVSEDSYKDKGYTVKINGSDAKFDEDGLAITSGSVSDTDKIEVSYENKRDSGSLTVNKILEGNAAETDRDFEFTVTLKAREDGIPFDDEYATVDNYGTSGTLAFTVDPETGDAVSETFTLKGDESLTILDILAGTDYLVHEEDYTDAGYLTEGNDAEGTIRTGDSSETVKNIRRLGSLSLQKTLSGNAANKLNEFVFRITLRNPDGLPVAGEYQTVRTAKNGTSTEGTVVFTENADGSAAATISLTGGEKILIKDIYADTTYTVSEEDYRASGYTTKLNNATGIIREEETAAFECINTRNAGSLSISKIVEAVGMGIPYDRKFTFTVTFTQPNGAPFTGTLQGIDQNGASHNIAFVGGTATIQLAHNESMLIQDIVVDTRYTVTEKAEDDVASTTSTGTVGTMTVDGAGASFTNLLRQEYASLKFRKEFSKAEQDKNKPTSVTVKVSNRDGEIGTYVLSIENNWEMTLENLPKYDEKGVEYSYTVLEIDRPDHYRTVYTTKNGVVIITNIFNSPVTIITDPDTPLGAGIVMNEGYCFE